MRGSLSLAELAATRAKKTVKKRQAERPPVRPSLQRGPVCRCPVPAPRAEGPLRTCGICTREIA